LHLQEKKSSFKDLNFFKVFFQLFSLNSLLVILFVGILSASMLSFTIHPAFAEENKANNANITPEISITEKNKNFGNNIKNNIENNNFIVNFFSDSEFSDATVRFEKPYENVSLVFVLSYENRVLKSEAFSIGSVNEKQEVTKVVFWGLDENFEKGIDSRKSKESYTAQLFVKTGNEILDSEKKLFLYQNPVLSNFKLVDFSADSEKASVLLTPMTRTSLGNMQLPEPSMLDLDLKLLSGAEVVYSNKQENIPVANTFYNATYWPLLLKKDQNYTALLKIHSHSPDLTAAYRSEFKAKEKVEILDRDVDVDEYGASVTILGRSQVPFDGIIRVVLTPREGKAQIFEETADILTAGKEDTVGIIWQGVPKRDYVVEVYVLNLEGEILDSYETVLRIFEPVAASTPAEDSPAPGFFTALGVFLLPVILFQIKRAKQKGKKQK
jgi:hypothetical protein